MKNYFDINERQIADIQVSNFRDATRAKNRLATEPFEKVAQSMSIDNRTCWDWGITATATTLRSDGAGGVTTTDGPFLETKEALGGFYLIDASDLDEAIKLASMLPEVQESHSGVEIRPVVENG